MTENNSFISGQRGPRFLFEFLIVLIVIGLIIFASSRYYDRPISGARISIVEFHAGVFARMMSNLHAFGSSTNKKFIDINGVKFFLNENGWPANTVKRMSSSVYNQTDEECRQLWNGVFRNPPSNELIGNRYKKNTGYIISLNEKVICRYELAHKQDGLYFFDYDVTNGAINVFIPE